MSRVPGRYMQIIGSVIPRGVETPFPPYYIPWFRLQSNSNNGQ